ncbi:unnamed protein product [Ostreobium quekettii]|uniref:Nudix hydrolase domain-containing protein n=1 Tax=Ostreobium quekettii TaxID=121088 RepID=A0A8S1J889_9CHLO|nr:unnamed protein product [Ostreobium quekettii]
MPMPLWVSCRGQLIGWLGRYPRPALTVDAAIVAEGAPPKLLLIKRKHPPCMGQWALPGGFVDEKEPLLHAAQRELQEETGVAPGDVQLVQVGAYGDPGRDPRGWTVSVAYAAMVSATQLGVKAADDAADAQWFDVGALPMLAFDHKLIVRDSFNRLAQMTSQDSVANDLAKGSKQLDGPWTPPVE